jgi:transposase
MSKKLSKADLEKLETASLVKLLLQAFDKIQALETKLEKQKRKNAKQTAPFSRNKITSKPKSPGRKKGQGNFTYKTPPAPSEVTTIVKVPLLELNCPKFGIGLPSQSSGTRVTFIIEIPRISQQVIEFRLEQKVCTKCGITVTAKCARVSESQTGASAFHISPKVLAIAHVLEFEKGIIAREIPAVLELTIGLRLTQSAITQAAIKNSLETKVVGQCYKTIHQELLQDGQFNTDDTGWPVNGIDSYLMTAVSQNAVVFQIRTCHNHKEVLELNPSSCQGVIATDRFKSYNVPALATIKQQECLFHIVNNLQTEFETLMGRARDFPLELRGLFNAALTLHHKDSQQAISFETYEKRGSGIIRQITELLTPRTQTLCVSSEQIRSRLEYHHNWENPLRFLENPMVSPTKHTTERALLRNVIFRKLCGDSKTQSGARALGVYSTVIQEAKRWGQQPVEVLAELYSQRE